MSYDVITATHHYGNSDVQLHLQYLPIKACATLLAPFSISFRYQA